MIELYGTINPLQNKEILQKTKRKLYYNNIFFDSKPELAFYIWLKDHKIRFEYHPSLINYEFNGKIYKYEPDFKVFNTLIEIKGLHFFENRNPNCKMINPYHKNKTPEQIKIANELAETKHQFMIKIGVKIITNYNKYISYVYNKYGNNYLNKFKVR